MIHKLIPILKVFINGADSTKMEVMNLRKLKKRFCCTFALMFLNRFKNINFSFLNINSMSLVDYVEK
jgi:hypothetical protein